MLDKICKNCAQFSDYMDVGGKYGYCFEHKTKVAADDQECSWYGEKLINKKMPRRKARAKVAR